MAENDGGGKGLDAILLVCAGLGLLAGGRLGFLGGDAANDHFEYLKQASDAVRYSVDIASTLVGGTAGASLGAAGGLIVSFLCSYDSSSK